MRKNTKRAVAVVAPLALLGVAGVAYAASLTTTSTDLGAGGTDVSSCATSAAISYTEKFVPGADAHYGLDTIKVAFTSPETKSCNGDNYRLVVTSTAAGVKGQKLQEYTNTSLQAPAAPATTGVAAAITSSALTFSVPDDIKAADVTGVYLVTEG